MHVGPRNLEIPITFQEWKTLVKENPNNSSIRTHEWVDTQGT